MYLNPIFIKEVPANEDGRDFIVGDLHGCFDELAKLLSYVEFNPHKDRLFSTGDLIDRGPRSIDCLNLLKKKWFYPVLGNHEDIFLIRFKMYEEGKTQGFVKEEFDFIKSAQKFVPNILNMPLAYEINNKIWGKIYVVHAEILPEHILGTTKDDISTIEYDRYFDSMKYFDFSNQLENFFQSNKNKEIDFNLKQKLIWSRSIIKQFHVDNQEQLEEQDFSFLNKNSFKQKIKVFCGHNVVPFPMKVGQQMYIDTGAALGYVAREMTTPIFSQFGHKYFALSMVEINTGVCYGCVTSEKHRGEIMKFSLPLYGENEIIVPN